MRAIARDLGAALGCGACCETLTRLAVGPFKIERAINLQQAAPEAVLAALVPVQTASELIDGFLADRGSDAQLTS